MTERSIGNTLEQLDGQQWANLPDDATDLMRQVYRLRQVPLESMSPHDLRLLIGQGVGLPFVIPRALDVLRQNPLVEATYYEGDLLASLLTGPLQFWTDNWPLLSQFAECVSRAEAMPNEIEQEIATFHDAINKQLGPTGT